MPELQPNRTSLASRSAEGVWPAQLIMFLSRSMVMRILLALTVVVALVLLPRASQPIALLTLLAASIFIAANRPNAAIGQAFSGVFRSAAPYLALFVVAAAVATVTAFSPLNHLLQIPKMIALNCAVLILFVLGRLIGPVPMTVLIKWIAGTALVATTLLLIEEDTFPFRTALGISDADTAMNYAVLNRSFLMATLVLAFLAVCAVHLKWWTLAVVSLAMIGLVCVTSHSDSARLIAVLTLVGLTPFARLHSALLLAACITATVAMVAGPFLYDHFLDAWRASALADYKVGTFLYRAETYADFSALIRDSQFLGRGFNVSKLIAQDPTLFAMPNRPCGIEGVFCPWHPHNAGLEVTTDLGFLGIAWLSAVIWRLRGLVASLADWQRPGIIVAVVGFLTVSFVADGVWQPWWWLVAGLIAMWIGILQNNPDRPVA